jgi:23S rRNA-/tRNA-specific pseudouridylate synthase
VFILAKEYNLKNLRTIHRLDRLTSGLLMFGRNPRKAREMEQQIRNRQVLKEYVCRVEGEFPEGKTECGQPVEVVSYKIGVCKVSSHGKECRTEFERLSYNGVDSVVVCRPFTGRMHQIRVHLQYLGTFAQRCLSETGQIHCRVCFSSILASYFCLQDFLS